MELQVAESWFQSISLADGVTQFVEPHVDPWLQPNTWHVRGRDRDLLIDTGMGLVSLKEALGELCERPILAVASHTHFDHVGSHHEFAERACHPSEAQILVEPTTQNTVADLITASSITALPHPGYDIRTYRILPAPPTRTIEEGDVLDLGDRVFKVLHLPGHSPGSIGLWEERTGIFFSGDAVYDGELLDNLYHSNVEVYLDTMRRLRTLPVRVVHCGHYKSFGRERMIELIDTYITSKKAPVCPAEVISPQGR